MFEIIISFILGILAVSTGYYVYTSLKIRKSYIIMRKRFEGLRQQNNERYAEVTQYTIQVNQWYQELEDMVNNLDVKSIEALNEEILNEKKQTQHLFKLLKDVNEHLSRLSKHMDILNGKINSLKEDPNFISRY